VGSQGVAPRPVRVRPATLDFHDLNR
jgi:hypothetical protein